MERANEDLRAYAKAKGVFLWQVAHQYGINDVTLSKRLRTPFSTNDAARFKNIVDRIAALPGSR
jgi:hypothetical protein